MLPTTAAALPEAAHWRLLLRLSGRGGRMNDLPTWVEACEAEWLHVRQLADWGIVGPGDEIGAMTRMPTEYGTITVELTGAGKTLVRTDLIPSVAAVERIGMAGATGIVTRRAIYADTTQDHIARLGAAGIVAFERAGTGEPVGVDQALANPQTTRVKLTTRGRSYYC